MSAVISIILIGVSLIIAGIGKAVMDTLQFHFSSSVFKKLKGNYFWDPSISWKNKYKNKDPKQGEAFPGSTTIFVFVTDAWHFFQFLFLRFIFAAMVLLGLFARLSPWSWGNVYLDLLTAYIALSIIFGLTFTLFYKYILK